MLELYFIFDFLFENDQRDGVKEHRFVSIFEYGCTMNGDRYGDMFDRN